MAGKLVSQATAAKILGVDRKLLRRWTKEGIVPSFTDPGTGRVRYSEPALDKWLEANCPGGES